MSSRMALSLCDVETKDDVGDVNNAAKLGGRSQVSRGEGVSMTAAVEGT